MSELIETWLLKTVDSRDVFMDSSGNGTLEGVSNAAFEFKRDEHPGGGRDALAKKVGNYLGVDCVWLSKFYESKDFYARSENVPKPPENPPGQP